MSTLVHTNTARIHVMVKNSPADALGLKPRPYRVLGDNNQPTNVADGVNFAVGGAGVFDNLGFTKTGDQILQLQGVLNSGVGGPYNSTVLAEILAVYGLFGNDYAAFLRNNANLVSCSRCTEC